MLTFLAAFALLGIVSAWILGHGYQNDFALSRWTKTLSLLDAEHFRLENLGLVYPHLPIYLLAPLYYLPGFSSSTAPFVLSTLVTAALLAHWNYRLAAKGYGLLLRLTLMALVGLHPLFLWSATSGTQNALSMALFYVLYLAVSRLVHDRDARSFIALALILAVYFFVDERATYIFIGLLPLIPLIVPRRMLNESIASVYIVLATPLVIVLLSWAYLSWIFLGDATAFLTTPGSAFLGAWQDAPYVNWLQRYGGTYIAPLGAIAVMVCLAFPVLLWVVFHSSRHVLLMRSTLVLIVHPIIVGMFATANYFLAHPVDILFLLNAGFMAGVVLLPRESHRARLTMMILLVAGWVGGWIVFNLNPTVEMQRWQASLFARNAESPYEPDRSFGEWLKHNSDALMMDDQVGYRAIAFAGSTKRLYLPSSMEFQQALMRRPFSVIQVAVPNPKLPYGSQDRINKAYPGLFEHGLAGYGLIYDANNWRVYRRYQTAQTPGRSSPETRAN